MLLVGLRLLSWICEELAASWVSMAAEGRVVRRDALDGVRLWRPARSAFKLSTPEPDSARMSTSRSRPADAAGCVRAGYSRMSAADEALLTKRAVRRTLTQQRWGPRGQPGDERRRHSTGRGPNSPQLCDAQLGAALNESLAAGPI